MGATNFMTKSSGETAQKAFSSAVECAQWEHGHGGYTGTIAEKHSFITLDLPEGADPYREANRLIDEDDRVSDKWGPAGCFDLGDGEYLFFGMASE